jgi:hypothetical protein
LLAFFFPSGIGVRCRGSLGHGGDVGACGVGCGAAFEQVVQSESAEFVDEAEADFAAHRGVAVAVRALDFVDDEFLHGKCGEGAAGAGEVESAGVVEAVEEVGADELGDEETFFVLGEGTDLNRR